MIVEWAWIVAYGAFCIAGGFPVRVAVEAQSLMDEHVTSAMPEPHRIGDKNVTFDTAAAAAAATESFMHYSTPDAAKTAVNRTHINPTGAEI